MKITAVSVGTTGDVQPLIELDAEMIRKRVKAILPLRLYQFIFNAVLG